MRGQKGKAARGLQRSEQQPSISKMSGGDHHRRHLHFLDHHQVVLSCRVSPPNEPIMSNKIPRRQVGSGHSAAAGRGVTVGYGYSKTRPEPNCSRQREKRTSHSLPQSCPPAAPLTPTPRYLPLIEIGSATKTGFAGPVLLSVRCCCCCHSSSSALVLLLLFLHGRVSGKGRRVGVTE